MVGYGTIIKPENSEIILSRGIGVRNMVDINALKSVFMSSPFSHIAVIVMIGLLITFIGNSKFGVCLRATRDSIEKARILGIDTANYEKNCGPENYGPSYRQFKKEVKSKIELKFTYHAGEDFDSLCSGLRAIDEVLEFLRFKRGDRLGHALALGIDADLKNSTST